MVAITKAEDHYAPLDSSSLKQSLSPRVRQSEHELSSQNNVQQLTEYRQNKDYLKSYSPPFPS